MARRTAEKRGTERLLSDRLRDILKPMAIGIDEGKLEEFTKACASLRNNLPHHSGESELGEYKRFVDENVSRVDVLSKLYFLVIISLLRIGLCEIMCINHHSSSSN